MPVALEAAVSYSRFSPKPKLKVDPDTIEVQEAIIDRYCLFAGLEVVHRLRDPLVSARNTRLYERPDGSKIPHLLAIGIKHIVAVRIDRLWRDSSDGIDCMREWVKDGVAFHFAAQGGLSMNCSDPTGRHIVRILLSSSEFEADLTSSRTSSQMCAYQKLGRRMTHVSKIPWGWMIDPNDPAKMIPCDEERALTIRINAMCENGASFSHAARNLNCLKCFCRGKPWDHRNVKRAAEAKWEE